MLNPIASHSGIRTKTKLQTTVDISNQYDIPLQRAEDVLYLRSRNRWSSELENELVRYIKEGIPYNLMEFGVTKQTQQKLIDDAENIIRMHRRMPHLVRSAMFLKSKGNVTTELYQAANNNWRVLINGSTHPLWCGFDTVEYAKEAISFCFD